MIRLKTNGIHTVKPLDVCIPKGRLVAVTGVSGSGKTTLILESLVPALESLTEGKNMPDHVQSIEAEGIGRVRLIDAAPIGINIRSTAATYANVHDELRRIFARTPDAKEKGYKAGDFSYNTGKLRCPVCDGTGCISLDVQFLPDEPQAGLVPPFAGAGYGQMLSNGSMDFVKRKSRPRKKPVFKADYASLSFGGNDQDYVYIKVPSYMRADLPKLLRKDISKIAAYLKKEGWSK